jgi:hypothetical protein
MRSLLARFLRNAGLFARYRSARGGRFLYMIQDFNYFGGFMSKSKRRKRYIEPESDFDETEKAEEEGETEDIYNNEQREKMLDEDEITAAEEAFMRGRDELPNKKETRKKSHDDSISVELSKEDAEDD